MDIANGFGDSASEAERRRRVAFVDPVSFVATATTVAVERGRVGT